jgi:hypothetical protein
MPRYDSVEPLIFMHVPKCGGVSVQTILIEWFTGRYFRAKREGFQSLVGDPRLAGAPSCIHEHFSAIHDELERTWPKEPKQLFTVLREPFQMFLSTYNYGLQLEGPNFAKTCGSLDAWLDAMIEKRWPSIFTWLPRRDPGESLEEFANRFMLIGTTEKLDETMRLLAEIIGKPVVPTPRLNTSREVEVSHRRYDEFREHFADDFAFYEMARDAIDAGKPLGWAFHAPTEVARAAIAVPAPDISLPS